MQIYKGIILRFTIKKQILSTKCLNIKKNVLLTLISIFLCYNVIAGKGYG